MGFSALLYNKDLTLYLWKVEFVAEFSFLLTHVITFIFFLGTCLMKRMKCMIILIQNGYLYCLLANLLSSVCWLSTETLCSVLLSEFWKCSDVAACSLVHRTFKLWKSRYWSTMTSLERFLEVDSYFIISFFKLITIAISL